MVVGSDFSGSPDAFAEKGRLFGAALLSWASFFDLLTNLRSLGYSTISSKRLARAFLELVRLLS